MHEARGWIHASANVGNNIAIAMCNIPEVLLNLKPRCLGRKGFGNVTQNPQFECEKDQE